MSDTPQPFTLGVHIKHEGHVWLPVRFVNQSTLHEEPTTGAVFIDVEEFVEMRNKAGEARFAILSHTRTAALRDKGPCRGIKPYIWKGAPNAEGKPSAGSESDSGHDNNNLVVGGEGEISGDHGDHVGGEPSQTYAGEGDSPRDGSVSS